MTRDPSLRTARGFTLLELIVAAGILALIAVFSWRGLDALVREREAIAASQASIDVLERTFARLERDALLAGDAELDGRGVVRLVASAGALDGSPVATVEYRLADGAVTRSVGDGAPMPLLSNVATMAAEAWVPAPRGGAWAAVKRRETSPPRAPAQGPVAQKPADGAAPAASPTTNVATPSPIASAPAANGAATNVPAATGIRLTFALADGARIVRTFVVGGA